MVSRSSSSKVNTKLGLIVGITITAIVLIAVSAILINSAKEPEVTVFDNSVQIKAMYGLTINFSDISNITLIENNIRDIGNVGTRVNGADVFGTLQGHFKSDTLGETLLFVHVNSSPTIRIERNNEKDIYLNFSNSEKTTTLFNELNTAINRNYTIDK